MIIQDFRLVFFFSSFLLLLQSGINPFAGMAVSLPTASPSPVASESIRTYPFYDLDLLIKPEEGSIEGIVKLTLIWSEEWAAANEEDSDKLYFLLWLNTGEKKNPHRFPFMEEKGENGFAPTWIRLNHITVNDQPAESCYVRSSRPAFLTYNQEHLLCEVNLPFRPVLGEKLLLTMDYRAQLKRERAQDNYYFENQLVSRFFWFPFFVAKTIVATNPVGSSSSPGTTTNPQPPAALPFMLYHAQIKIPREWQMVASGPDFKELTADLTDNSTSRTFEVQSRQPAASFPLCFLKDYKVYEQALGERTLRCYYQKELESQARYITQLAEEALTSYQQILFPLDYKHISLVQGTPGYWGITSQSIITLGDVLFSGMDRFVPHMFDRALHYVVANEVAHLYFAAHIPRQAEYDFLSDSYLSEGLAQYLSRGYMEQCYGLWDNMLNRQNDLLSFLMELIVEVGSNSFNLRGVNYAHLYRTRQAGWDRPLVQAQEDRIINRHEEHKELKGLFTMSMLAQYLGKESFDAALRNYISANYRQGYAYFSPESFKAALETDCGKDLTPFFDAFVYNNKTLDYELTGTLNRQDTSGAYQSHFLVKELGSGGLFIPTKLTLFYKDNSEEEMLITKPGEISHFHSKPLAYAGLDRDLHGLDYNRYNNFFPRQTVSDGTEHFWLLDDGAVLVGLLEPFFGLDEEEDIFFLGLGPEVYYSSDWRIATSPLLGFPLGMDELFALDFKFGAGLSLEFYLPRFNRIIFKGLYQLPDNFSLIQLSYDKQFYPEQDIGLPGHYYAPGWGLSMAAGLGDWLIGTPDDPDTFFFTKTSLDYNGLEKWGHSTRLSHTFHYYPNEPDAKAFENRLGFESLQALPFFPRTLLAFGLEGSMGLGQLKQLAASNAVLGWEETQGVLAARFPYALRFRLFLGLPLFNALEIGLSNSVVLQSLNIALVYEVASAFAAWEEFPGNLQQALGLEFLPYYRTIFDKGFGFGFGISFNLTNILNNAASGSSYRPGFFISLDPVSKLYSAVVAY